LEQKRGYIFRTEDTGRDYIYHLVSTNDVPYQKPARVHRAQILKDAAELVQCSKIITQPAKAIEMML
jgi:hypothetical protein